MKTIKSIIVATLLIAGTTMMAQSTPSNNNAKAIEKTSELVCSLNLTNEQTLEILDIYQKYMNMEAYNASNSNLSKKAAIKAEKKLVAAQAKEIKSVLKKFQQQKAEEMAAAPEMLVSQSTPSVALNSASQTIIFGTDAPTNSFMMW